MNLKILRRPFVVLLTVPAGIAFLVGCLPLLTVYLEQKWLAEASVAVFPTLEFESARTVLSVVAGGAMTALSLTYSLVLVVFTLAAGNIGPRMLKRFTSDLVNQITAGIFGGTFLYAIATILFVEREFIPKFTIIGAGILAVLCVMQLVYFVRHVSRTVTIDDEIAAITTKLKMALDERVHRTDAAETEDTEHPEEDFVYEICAGKSGYLCVLSEERLVKSAREEDVCLKAHKNMGEYTLSDEVLFSVTKKLDEDFDSSIQKLVSIQPSRSEDSPIEFSINLLLEIALRALSPGINDTYTAIAAVDSMSDALSAAVSHGDMSSVIRKDEDGIERLIIPELSPEHLINQAFHPLRRAAGDNILMSQCLARAYARLYETAGENVRTQLEDHGLLLLRKLEQMDHFKEDIDSVTRNLPKNIQNRYVQSQDSA